MTAWHISAVAPGSLERDDSDLTQLPMKWAHDAASGKPLYIHDDPVVQGTCQCLCPACKQVLIPVLAGQPLRTDPTAHFRHPPGTRKDACTIVAARLAATEHLLETGFIDLPRRTMSRSAVGFSGERYEVWVEIPEERRKIKAAGLIDRTTAELMLDDGRILLVDLTGQATAATSANAAMVTIALSDPILATLSVEEIRSRLRILPGTRIRRGRLYEWGDGSLQQTWYFTPHPAEPMDRDHMTMDGRLNRTLWTYRPAQSFSSLFPNILRAQLVLGTQSAPTVWQVVSVETVASGEELLTLRARSSFGALPELIEEHIPEGAKTEVLATLAHVADGAFRSSPVSLVDLCRAAATVVLAHWLESTGDAPDKVHYLDLGALLKAFEKQQGNPDTNSPSAAGSAIRLLQRFHSRGKPNEQKRYNTRPPTEEDAQLVLGALGFLLREVGWAR
ncbi:hypothetical protein [Dechloromonas sp. CZR5]|uniref:hypothetical protein n=1 Tax=Dechloromonas sp. CZR5 TaxID=2608630 RepID=UPI00123D2FC4|nr:hypothetical protein [Dechloromonas sp. CZR5]